MGVTMNGYTRIDAVDGRLALVAVAGHSTRLLGGPVARVLTEVGRRFHAEVEPVSTFNGWRSAALNAGSGGIGNSNHLSGTAVDINGYRHPRYQHGTFTAAQVATIRRILADLGGVVRWGGDWNGDGRLTEADTDEMHFEVVASSGAVTTVANRIGQLGSVPTVPDIHTPTPITPEADMPLDQADKEFIDKDLVDRLNQRLAQGVLAQVDVEALDRVIIGRVKQALAERAAQPLLTNQADQDMLYRLVRDLTAQAVAPVLAAVSAIGVASGVDPAAIAKAVQDEQDARERQRLQA